MYADDTVLYVNAKNKEQVASELCKTMTNVNKCLNDSHMSLDVQKTVCIVITKSNCAPDYDPYVNIIYVVSN